MSTLHQPVTVSKFTQDVIRMANKVLQRTGYGYIAILTGSSMQPTLNPKPKVPSELDYESDVTFVRLGQTLKRGDVVGAVLPTKYDKDTGRIEYIPLGKRLLALEGDTIKPRQHNLKAVVISKGHCWLEGDNPKSGDSTHFRAVPLTRIVGKQTHILLPLKRFGKIPSEFIGDRRPLKIHDGAQPLPRASYAYIEEYDEEFDEDFDDMAEARAKSNRIEMATEFARRRRNTKIITVMMAAVVGLRICGYV